MKTLFTVFTKLFPLDPSTSGQWLLHDSSFMISAPRLENCFGQSKGGLYIGIRKNSPSQKYGDKANNNPGKDCKEGHFTTVSTNLEGLFPWSRANSYLFGSYIHDNPMLFKGAVIRRILFFLVRGRSKASRTRKLQGQE